MSRTTNETSIHYTFGHKKEFKTEIPVSRRCPQRKTAQTEERSQCLLLDNNIIASLRWNPTDHGSHTPLQDDGPRRRRAADGAADGAAAQKQTIVNDGREHRDGCVKLSETIEWWMNLVFLTMNGL